MNTNPPQGVGAFSLVRGGKAAVPVAPPCRCARAQVGIRLINFEIIVQKSRQNGLSAPGTIAIRNTYSLPYYSRA